MTGPGVCAGTYVLILHAGSPAARVAIGRFGVLAVQPGYYVYVGSAFGPGGLKARLAHHAGPAKSPHWHIDYLRAALPLRELQVRLRPDAQRIAVGAGFRGWAPRRRCRVSAGRRLTRFLPP